MALIDMALSPGEAEDTMLCSPADPKEGPKYPYGLRLDLNDITLTKLGLTMLPKVGEEVAITAVAKVVSINAYEEQEGVEQCLGLQIVGMDVNIPSQVQTPAGKLYGETS